ncbi:hypothetical protein [Sphingobacterium tabacisoli]|uniref:Uncharacterized protein n=1 Tax=Sphingobacterium tabacisoli TaxID=2044855 RepID=A0ABW5L1L7_9SPHI|nr:hypothetical protein [Sphingobacterium tabacisoli]
MNINWQDPSFLLSVIAVLGTLFTYLIHDRKIKAQEKLINDYQLDKIEEEKNRKRQATVRASLIKGNKGHRILRVYNKGQAIAKNVRLIIKDEPDYLYSTNPFPFPVLNEHENIDLDIHLHMGSPDNISFEILWDDESATDNKHSQIVQL